MKKPTLVEWLVSLTIILTIAGLIVRGIWGNEMREKEKAFSEALGLNYGFVQIGIFTVFFGCLLIWCLRDWRRRQATKQRKSRLKLPDE